MIFLTLIASILIATVSIYQFRKEAREYHQDRLERKETAIAEHINYVLQTTTYPLSTENIPLIFKEKIFELADIHSMEINFFDLKGKLLISSKAIFKLDKDKPKINPSTLRIIQSSLDKRYIEFSKIEGQSFRSSYTYLKDTKFKPMGILNLPYEENTEFYDNEVQNFLIRFGQVYVFMFLISIVLSYFLSSYITKSLKIISDKMQETQLNQRNEKIVIEDGSKEINLLIKSYNNMVDKLEESATILAQSEREQAWREMAKQVAHEIKNPLTPMRLTVQSFQRKFDSTDVNISKKLDDYTKTILQQIDTMSSVANAFSNFATMPAQQNETLNVVYIVKMALEIFNEDFIQFSALEDEIIAKLDRTQLIRVITNLVKNAVQAIPEEQENKMVFVTVFRQDNEVKIAVKDNGKGISEENIERVFEPKFTTKSSGMGLGLAIIKNIIENYNGTITFDTQSNEGTEFLVSFPINDNK
ncbi:MULTISPECIES: PAS domain-containing sensor histidine kinase [unclassified Flavobacterium]|uniref:sensor histidine kinase n=1 Tax=unclassified Flavobacterium TaxID=196869 RepID=UPI0012921865|nr:MULTISPECIES: ATP-binding protein [unclassified Flavobacterium]MQP51448.1 GHKL domain-containing protein [Flavobacterium sp. LMO9]MQP61324.1 GHKL domain-containing protein [Flavobacterium sp. LMO6]